MEGMPAALAASRQQQRAVGSGPIGFARMGLQKSIAATQEIPCDSCPKTSKVHVLAETAGIVAAAAGGAAGASVGQLV
jgi:hypothetical protein